MTPSQLDALALKLKLSKRQRLFCEALAAKSQEQGSQAAAMREAGYKGKPNTLYAGASVLVRRPKVQAYLKALTQTATEMVVRKSAVRILTLGESLANLSEMAEGRRPTEARVYRETNGDRRIVKRYAMGSANEQLARFHQGEYAQQNAPPKPIVTNIQINFDTLSLEERLALREMWAKVMGAAEHSGNGDPGNGAPA